MKCLNKPFFAAALLVVTAGFAQNTVYITAQPEEDEKAYAAFPQFSVSIPLNTNPDRGNDDAHENDSWFIPDGLSTHVGYGMHYQKWIGISANTGIDWRIKYKLVSVPVYASLIINPHFNKETSVVLQAGLGHAFAVGYGSLSGTYQKYRAGIMFDDIVIFADASYFGFPVESAKQAGSFTLGVSIINF